MKYLTMVARCGAPKAPASEMVYTLIGDDFSIHTLAGNKLAAALNDGKAVVTNMAMSAKGLVSTNGALSNYTQFDPSGALIGKPRYVILNRIEVNGKLTGYKVFTADGIVNDITPTVAADLAKNEMLANGKIRHTAEGDIVAAIGGNFPLLETVVTTVPAKKGGIKVDVVFFSSVIGADKGLQFAGFTVTGKNAVEVADCYSVLKAHNKTLVQTLAEKFGMPKEKLSSFVIKQMPGAGFYGVYKLDVAAKMIDKAGGYKCSFKTPMIGCMDAASDFDESIVFYDVKKDAIVKSVEGSETSDAKLKGYYKKITELLKKYA